MLQYNGLKALKTHVNVGACLQRPEENVRSAGGGVTGSGVDGTGTHGGSSASGPEPLSHVSSPTKYSLRFCFSEVIA